MGTERNGLLRTDYGNGTDRTGTNALWERNETDCGERIMVTERRGPKEDLEGELSKGN